MKKIIISLMTMIWGILLLSNIFAAPMPPQPVGGKIYGGIASVDNLRIVIFNKGTGETLDTYTNSNGEWLIEMANANYAYGFGNNLDITVWMCKDNSICTKQATIEGNPIFVEFDISSILYQCPICPDCPECPIITTTTVTTTICPELNSDNCLPYCEECHECPDVTINYIIEAIVLLIAGGIGIKIYRKSTGEIAKLHKHPGIVAYHDPNTVHTNKNIRHPKGMIFPKYEKRSDGKWYFIGGK